MLWLMGSWILAHTRSAVYTAARSAESPSSSAHDVARAPLQREALRLVFALPKPNGVPTAWLFHYTEQEMGTQDWDWDWMDGQDSSRALTS